MNLMCFLFIIIGVTINSQLSVSAHVSSVIGACAQTKFHVHTACAPQHVYRSVVIAKLLYAASAWWRFASAADRRCLYKQPSDAASVLDPDCAISASQLWLNCLTPLMKYFLNVLWQTQTMYLSVAYSAIYYSSQPSPETPRQNITGQANTSRPYIIAILL